MALQTEQLAQVLYKEHIVATVAHWLAQQEGYSFITVSTIRSRYPEARDLLGAIERAMCDLVVPHTYESCSK